MKSKTVKQRRRYRVKDQSLLCDICGRRFQRPQALFAHKRMLHLVRDKTIPDPDPGIGKEQLSPQETIKNLEGEVKQLKLEKEKRQLTAELPTASARPDIMEQAGLGSLEGESKMLAQKRAMGVGQEQHQGWIDRIMSNPEALKLAIAGLKGVLGTNNNNQGDNMATLLKEMGFSLKDLLTQATSPKSGSFEIAGMNLSGVSMTPQLLGSLLDYKAKTESAQIEAAGKKEMSDTLANMIKLIGQGIGSGAISFGKSGPGRNREIISEKYIPGSEPAGVEVFTCPKCGAKNELPAEAQQPGMKIKCQGEGCGEMYTVVDNRAQQKPEREKKQVEVQEPPTTIACETCGQMLAIEGKPLGSELVCPICQKSQVLMSPDIALDPESAEPGAKQFLR